MNARLPDAPKAPEKSPPGGVGEAVIIHATAEVSPEATLGRGTKIWNCAQVREGVVLGPYCTVGSGAYIDFDVVIGSNVKIQSSALLYHGLVVEDGVFIGPQAVFTNDKVPRAVTPEGVLKSDSDWKCGRTIIREGASIGACAVVLPDVQVGRCAMVGAGAVVVDDVKDFSLVLGTPARHVGWICMCGEKLRPGTTESNYKCHSCHRSYVVKTVAGDTLCEFLG